MLPLALGLGTDSKSAEAAAAVSRSMLREAADFFRILVRLYFLSLCLKVFFVLGISFGEVFPSAAGCPCTDFGLLLSLPSLSSQLSFEMSS